MRQSVMLMFAGKGAFRCALRLAALTALLAPAALPQGIGGGMGGLGRGMPPGQGQGQPEEGFGFYDVAAYFGYTSSTVPFSASFPVSGLELGPNYLAGISATGGWQHFSGNTTAHIIYTLSYDASLRYSSWNSLNHYLNFGVTHDFSPRWSFHLSGLASTMRWDQYLFEPTLLSEVADVPSTFDELSSAILSGNYSNGQLASILTGAPILDSPAATLLYGTRFFNASMRTGLSYNMTPRLHLRADANGNRTQHLHTDDAQLNGLYLVPSVTSATATVGLSYDLSPVTTIGLTGSATRTFSRFDDAYSPNGAITIGRVFGRHWIVNAHGGAGTYIPVRQIYAYGSSWHYVAGGTVTYKALTQMVTLQYNHTIQDPTGLGGQSTDMASGQWTWHKPGEKWILFCGGSYQSVARTELLNNINAWFARAGIERTVGRHTTVMAGYAYGRETGIVGAGLSSSQIQAANLVISWSPRVLGL